MPIPFLNSIKLNKNQVEDFCVFNYSGDPTLSSGADYGYLWLNTTNAGGVIPTLKWWDGTNIRSLIDSTNISAFTAGLATDLAGGGAGQVVYQDGANDTKFLAAGTAGQVLSSNAANAPSWLNQSSLAAGTATNISGGLAGQLLYQSAIATTAKLTIGTAGQALVVNSGATAPEWVDQSSLSVGSATNKTGGNLGDILVQTGSGTTSFLNAGTAGQVITSNGASPQYVNQSSLSVGSATTSGTATNIAGGAANRIPYQTAAGTTAFISDNANAILTTNASSVPALTSSNNVTVGKAVDIALGAAGDLLYQSASNDTSFLNIGANGSILTSTGTAPQWSASIPSGSVSGLAASATTDTTNASNISSGTLGLARLSLATGQFYVGDGSNNPAATLKSSIPLSGFGAAGANVAMGSFKITGLADPESGTDAANKNYVDSVAQGLDVKASCKVGTIANITLSGPGASIDGISLSVDDRVLVKDQTDKKENGIYLWKGAALAMVRSADADTVAKLTSAFTFVEQGTNADSGWVCTVDSGTIGSVNIEWQKFSQAGSYTAGRGMVLAGTDFNFAQSTNYTANTIPYASGATTIGFIGAGNADQVLRVPGAGGTPAFGAIDLSKSAAVTGTLAVGNGGTGITSFGAGIATFLGTPTSENLATAVTDETGTGALVFAGSPTLTGTPLSTTAVADTNTTQIATTAYVVGQASATTPAALGTAAVGTSLKYARADHVHALPTIDLANGVTGTLPVANGGTGAATFTAGRVLFGNGTSALNTSANLFWDNSNNRLGIGTATPGAKLDINAGTNLNLAVGGLTLDNFTGDGVGITFSRTTSDDDLMAVGVCDANKLGLFSREGVIFATGGASLYGQTSEKMRLDSSGNLGLGVTPSAWVAGYRAMQVGYATSFSGHNTIELALMSSNAYLDATDDRWERIVAGYASQYYQTNSTHVWRIAGTAAANTEITWNPAMTLDASGNLCVGTASAKNSSSGRGNITIEGTGSAILNLSVNNTDTGYILHDGTNIALDNRSNGYLRIKTNDTERLRIKSTGQVNFVGLASDPAGAAGDVVYNSTSNRLKYHNGTAWVNTGTNKYSGALTGTGTSFTVTHNLGTRDVTVAVRKSGSTYDQVFTDVQMATDNTVTIIFASSVTGSDYTVTVIG